MNNMKTTLAITVSAISLLTLTARGQGPVGHWPFNEGSGRSTADVSGNNNNGQLRGGGGPQWVAGQLGTALRFDGADEYVNVAASPVFSITGDITMAAWIKRESPGAYDAIIAKTDGSAFFDFDFYFSSGDNRLRLWSDAGTPTPVFSSREVADTNWHHVAVTRAGSTVTFYIDGLEAGTTSMSGAFPINSIPIRIGTDGPAWDPGSLFQGAIDEARIYNRALSGNEIRALNTSGTGPEVVVVFNGTVLTAGDMTPSFADGTDFGVVDVGASSTRMYDIYNFGTTTLTIGQVGVSGGSAADFTLIAQPAGSLAPGANTSFSLRFSPGGLGRRSATVSFSNNDSNENPYTFGIHGSGLSTTVFPGFLTREVFSGIPGESIADLTNHAKFPNAPDASEIIGGFEAPVNSGTDFGQRIYGFLTPWETANYIFFIASDDQGELWLSTDESPANKMLVAREPEWTSSRDWSGTENRSAPIQLQAGRRYYVEALGKEGAGGDNLAVTAIKDGEALPENGSLPLQGAFVGTFGVPGTDTVAISGEPQSVSTTVGRTATFLVTATSSANPIVYQWQKDGVNMFKATAPMLTTPPLTAADTGTEYRCIVYVNSGAAATSAVATVTVNEDVSPPKVLRVHALGDPITGVATRVVVVFDEPVEASTGQDEFNYSIGENFAVTGAGLLPSLKAVVLTTDALPPTGGPYAVTVENVADLAASRNVIAPVTVPFRITHLVARYGFDDFADLGVDSVGAHDGAAFGGPALVAGQIGNALGFDDIDDYLSVPYHADFAISGDITLAAWIKRHSLSQYGGLIAKTDGATTWDFDLQFQSGQHQLTFYSDNTGPSTIISSNGITDTGWHHVAFTRNGNAATFYIDGVDAGTATLEGSFGGNQNPIRIGTDGPAWDAGSMFHGAMDDVRIYNRALSAIQVQALMGPPRLSIAQSDGSVALSWPAASIDFVLESSDSLAPANWTVVPETPIPNGNQNTVTLSVGPGAKFYRLKE